MSKAKLLRELFEKKDIVCIMGAHNGLTAKLVEKHGFDGVWASGLELSTSHAVPDASILTMSDLLQATISMNDATKLPIIVDCDTGFGNSMNVMHLVKKFESAGVAGIVIEDKKFPKQNSLLEDGRQELASISEFVGKIMAAKNTQISEDFMVFARVEALIAGCGLDEALERAKAYVKAGADGIFIHSNSKEPAEILEFINRWDEKIPLILCPTTYSKNLTLEDFKKAGKVKMIIYANHGIRAAIKAINETFSKIKETGKIYSVEDKIATLEEVFELQGMPELKAKEKIFLKGEEEPITVIIPAAGKNIESSFSSILRDIPIAMLDINGKPLLQRNIEILNNSKIFDINVITGYKADKIKNIKGVNIIYNPDYESTGILHSILQAKDKLNGKVLLIYSDIIFDEHLIEKVIKSKDDVVLVVDGTYQNSPLREYKRKKGDLDLVKAKEDPIIGKRIIKKQRDNPILKIGKNLPSEESNYEFVGIALFSPEGIKIVKKECEELLKEKGSSFVEKAFFVDLIQKMIDDGYKVSSLEVTEGWSEIHTFEDYKHICSILK